MATTLPTTTQCHPDSAESCVQAMPASFFGACLGVLTACVSAGWLQLRTLGSAQGSLDVVRRALGGEFYLIFAAATIYFLLTEAFLEDTHFRAYQALKPRWAWGEFLARVVLTAMFGGVIALPQFSYFSFLQEFEYRLLLLASLHLSLLVWDLIVLTAQEPSADPLVTWPTSAFDFFGGLICALTVVFSDSATRLVAMYALSVIFYFSFVVTRVTRVVTRLRPMSRAKVR